MEAIEPTQEAPKDTTQESYSHDKGLNLKLQGRDMFNIAKSIFGGELPLSSFGR